MALVAVHAVIHIALNSLVILVRLGFRMAIRALKNRVVVRIGVARRADSVGIAMGDGEWRVLRVIKRRIQPVRGAMTVLARHREELRLGCMPGICRVVVVGLVAADACSRQTGVVIVDVAVGARPRRHGVRAGQRERSVVVVEGRVRPLNGVMAKLAGRREAGVRHRTVRSGEILLMARDAERAVQLVVIVDVTIRARSWRHGMGARQWKTGLRVIEFPIRPLHRVMTLAAGGRETRVRNGTGRIVEIGLVAADACSRQTGVVIVDVAVGARARRHGV